MQYKQPKGVLSLFDRLCPKKMQKNDFLLTIRFIAQFFQPFFCGKIIQQNDREIVRMVVHFRITGQIGFGSANLYTDLFACRLYPGQILRHEHLHHALFPLPSAVSALDADTSPTDRQAVDELQRKVLVQYKDFCQKPVAGNRVNFPHLAVGTGYKFPGFNQFQ